MREVRFHCDRLTPMAYKIPEPPEELLRQFDKDGNEVEPRTRQWMWDHPDYEPYHATGTIWLINSHGQILFSKRSELLKGSPGKWQTMFGGKVSAGSTCRETAIRELEEEAGIVPDSEKLFLVEESPRFARYIYPFDGDVSDLCFHDGEVTAARWMSLEEYQQEVQEHPEEWCNPIKPHQEIMIKKWIVTHCV